MTLAIRFYPQPGRPALSVAGRHYPVTGTTVDVPYPDALHVADDQALRLMIVGSAADRPAYRHGIIGGGIPSMMYDTTLGAPIFYVPGSNPPRWIGITGEEV